MSFNLSEWALRNRQIVLFLMLLLAIVGAISYTKLVGFRLKRIKNNYSNLFFKTTKERLVTFLNDWAKREGRFTGEEVHLDNFLTQKEISQIICSSRQTTTQLFNEWEQQGLITYSRKEIMIKNLRELA